MDCERIFIGHHQQDARKVGAKKMIETLPHTSSIPLDAIRPYPDTLSRPVLQRHGSAYVVHANSWGEGIVVAVQPHPSTAGNRVNDDLLTAAKHIARLLHMPPNWDSYGAKAIDRHRAVTAFYLLWIAIANGAPMPALIPTSDGGIQLEWHRCGADLELRVISETALEVFFEDLATGKMYEGEIEVEVDLASLRLFLDRVSC